MSPVAEVVVPHAVRDVAGDVGVERVLLHRVALVVGVPRAVGVLHRAQPVVGALGFGEAAADVERHRGFDEVPRIGVAAGNPRDVAVGLLHRRDRVDRLRDLRGGDDAGDFGEVVLSQGCASRTSPSVGGDLLAVHDEALAEHRVERPLGDLRPASGCAR